MTYYQKRDLEKYKNNIARPWRSTWLKAIEDMSSADGDRLIYAASNPERIKKIEKTVELWGDYRKRSGRWGIGLGGIKKEDLLPLLEVHYYRRRLASPDAPPDAVWEALNTVMRPKEVKSNGLSKFTSDTTFGFEIECFGLDKVVGKGRNSQGKEYDILKSYLLFPLLNRLIPKVSETNRWDIIRENGVLRQGKPDGFEVISPILNDDNAKYAEAALQLIRGLDPYVNSSCSLHVHAGIDDGKRREIGWYSKELKGLGWKEDFSKFKTIQPAKQFLINYIMLEDKLSFLDHRLIHTYKDTFKQSGITADQAIQRIIRATNFEQLLHASRPDAAKYKRDSDDWNKVTRQRLKVNVVRALMKHGTIEIRHHPGTVDPQEIVAWTRFVDKVMKQSKDMTWGFLSPPHKPSKSEMAKLNAIADTFISERGSTKIINDAELPPDKRAFDTSEPTNKPRPIGKLSVDDERFPRSEIDVSGSVYLAGIQADQALSAGR